MKSKNILIQIEDNSIENENVDVEILIEIIENLTDSIKVMEDLLIKNLYTEREIEMYIISNNKFLNEQFVNCITFGDLEVIYSYAIKNSDYDVDSILSQIELESYMRKNHIRLFYIYPYFKKVERDEFLSFSKVCLSRRLFLNSDNLLTLNGWKGNYKFNYFITPFHYRISNKREIFNSRYFERITLQDLEKYLNINILNIEHELVTKRNGIIKYFSPSRNARFKINFENYEKLRTLTNYKTIEIEIIIHIDKNKYLEYYTLNLLNYNDLLKNPQIN